MSCDFREQLVEQPFAPLTQQYETCSNDPTTALFTQAGVSAGNVSLLSPLGVLLVLALLAAYQFCSGAHIPRSYSRGDKDAALDAFAVAMLLVRDRRLGQCQGDVPTSLDAKVSGEVETAMGTNLWQSNSADGVQQAQQPQGAACADAQARDAAAALANIVEALAQVAAASQQDASLLHRSAQEPVFVDWSRLGARMRGGATTGSGSTGARAATSGSDSGGTLAPRPGESRTQREAVMHRHKSRRRAADSDDDDDDDEVELSTISGMHQSSV
jgi:hypothetical protein